jgi:hypothetical protein
LSTSTSISLVPSFLPRRQAMQNTILLSEDWPTHLTREICPYPHAFRSLGEGEISSTVPSLCSTIFAYTSYRVQAVGIIDFRCRRS